MKRGHLNYKSLYALSTEAGVLTDKLLSDLVGCEIQRRCELAHETLLKIVRSVDGMKREGTYLQIVVVRLYARVRDRLQVHSRPCVTRIHRRQHPGEHPLCAVGDRRLLNARGPHGGTR